MNSPQEVLIIGLIAVLVLDVLTVAARSALANVNLTHLMSGNGNGAQPAQRALHLLNPRNALQPQAALHIGLNLIRFLFVGLAIESILPLVQTIANPVWAGAGVLLLSALLISWLEWIVALGVSRHPEHWAIRMAPYVQFLSILLFPITFLTLWGVTRPRTGELSPNTVTEDELKSLVDASQQEGVLEQEERKMIYSIFRLGDTLAREIMIPRIDLTAIDVNMPFDEAVRHLLKSGFSRVPVYEESIDNILGLLYTKDLLRVFQEGGRLASLRSLLRPAYFVPEAKKVDEMLAEMQSQRVHMAIVVDEYGGVAGLVTLEDIVEEIVGEIQDEFDQAEELPYQEIQPGEFIFQGRIDLEHFNDIMGSNIEDEDAETLGGFLYNQIGQVPMPGENLDVGDIRLTIEQVLGRRIRKVRAQKLLAPPDGQGPHEEEEKTNAEQ